MMKGSWGRQRGEGGGEGKRGRGRGEGEGERGEGERGRGVTHDYLTCTLYTIGFLPTDQMLELHVHNTSP